MVKTIIKEILITIVILAVMLLLLGVVLYNNVTINKIIPEIAKYETPEKIQNEISETSETGFKNEILTYEVTDSDLKLYKKESIYNPGKANPFMENSTGSLNTNIITNTNKNSNSNTKINNVINTNNTQKTK